MARAAAALLLVASLGAACGESPGTGPSATCERDERAVVLCLRAGDIAPTAALLTAADEEDATPGSGCWMSGNVQRCVDTVDVPAGTYVVDAYGSWSEGESTFYFGIRIAPAS